MSLLEQLTIVLCRPKFAENVGAAARACANMGCPNLIIISPQGWSEKSARALATPKGAEVLKAMKVYDDLGQALAGFHTVYGTTARVGGWRKGVLSLPKAAPLMCEAMAQGRVAVVFGTEEHGLTNDEVEICGKLVTIPTAGEATSLNLAQAVLLVLYECLKEGRDTPFHAGGSMGSRPATHQEQEHLYKTMKETLLAIDFLKDDNPDYWMLPVRRFFQRVGLKHNEFGLIMGVLKQVDHALAGRIRKLRELDEESSDPKTGV